jgi:hypothetical protein
LALTTILWSHPQNKNGVTWEAKNFLETLNAKQIKPNKVYPFKPQPSEILPKRCITQIIKV